MKRALLQTQAPKTVVLIRLMTGLTFLSEGIQKFLFPHALGVGRFLKIGLPAPHLLAPFVGGTEILCGALLVLGLLTRLAVFPLLIVMVTAITVTKMPILMKQGFWAMAHEARTDWCMGLGCLFLMITGGGQGSMDDSLQRRLDHDA